jgi:hypothetical protein
MNVTVRWRCHDLDKEASLPAGTACRKSILLADSVKNGNAQIDLKGKTSDAIITLLGDDIARWDSEFLNGAPKGFTSERWKEGLGSFLASVDFLQPTKELITCLDTLMAGFYINIDYNAHPYNNRDEDNIIMLVPTLLDDILFSDIHEEYMERCLPEEDKDLRATKIAHMVLESMAADHDLHKRFDLPLTNSARFNTVKYFSEYIFFPATIYLGEDFQRSMLQPVSLWKQQEEVVDKSARGFDEGWTFEEMYRNLTNMDVSMSRIDDNFFDADSDDGGDAIMAGYISDAGSEM